MSEFFNQYHNTPSEKRLQGDHSIPIPAESLSFDASETPYQPRKILFGADPQRFTMEKRCHISKHIDPATGEVDAIDIGHTFAKITASFDIGHASAVCINGTWYHPALDDDTLERLWSEMKS